MFISICVMGTQKGDNPNIFISELLPLFCQKVNCSDKAPEGDTHALGSTPFQYSNNICDF